MSHPLLRISNIKYLKIFTYSKYQISKKGVKLVWYLIFSMSHPLSRISKISFLFFVIALQRLWNILFWCYKISKIFTHSEYQISPNNGVELVWYLIFRFVFLIVRQRLWNKSEYQISNIKLTSHMFTSFRYLFCFYNYL